MVWDCSFALVAGTRAPRTIRNAFWIAPWLGGQVIIGLLGGYGHGAMNVLPNWMDIAVVVAFALTIYYWAVSLAQSEEATAAAVASDGQQLAYETPEG